MSPNDDEIGTLGPKDVQGIDKDYLRAKTNKGGTVVQPAPGAPLYSKPDIQLPTEELLKEKLFPVRMLRGYRPKTSHFQLGDETRNDNGDVTGIEYHDAPDVPEDQDAGSLLKIVAGRMAMLPISEAREIIRRGIADRADDIT